MFDLNRENIHDDVPGKHFLISLIKLASLENQDPYIKIF